MKKKARENIEKRTVKSNRPTDNHKHNKKRKKISITDVNEWMKIENRNKQKYQGKKGKKKKEKKEKKQRDKEKENIERENWLITKRKKKEFLYIINCL